jgi:hypothetical protein
VFFFSSFIHQKDSQEIYAQQRKIKRFIFQIRKKNLQKITPAQINCRPLLHPRLSELAALSHNARPDYKCDGGR